MMMDPMPRHTTRSAHTYEERIPNETWVRVRDDHPRYPSYTGEVEGLGPTMRDGNRYYEVVQYESGSRRIIGAMYFLASDFVELRRD